MLHRILFLVTVLSLPLATAVAKEGTFPVQRGYLSIGYENFQIRQEPGGVDLIYTAPGAFERLGKYRGVVVDQPEIWIDEDSDYGGAKPDDLKAIADLLREALTDRLKGGGPDGGVSQQPSFSFSSSTGRSVQA